MTNTPKIATNRGAAVAREAITPRRKPGRPPQFSQAVAEHICVCLATGIPLTKIVRGDGMPKLTAVYRWLAERPEFGEMYARARADMAHTVVAEILEIADDARNDWVERNGERVVDNEAVQRSRLRVDARKWAAAKLLPKVYGDKIEQTVTGPDSGPVKLEVEAKVQARLAESLARLRAKLAANPPNESS